MQFVGIWGGTCWVTASQRSYPLAQRKDLHHSPTGNYCFVLGFSTHKLVRALLGTQVRKGKISTSVCHRKSLLAKKKTLVRTNLPVSVFSLTLRHICLSGARIESDYIVVSNRYTYIQCGNKETLRILYVKILFELCFSSLSFFDSFFPKH